MSTDQTDLPSYVVSAAEKLTKIEEKYDPAEHGGETKHQKKKPVRKAAASTPVVARYWLRRSLDAAKQTIGRIATPRPAKDEANEGAPFLVIGHRGSAANVVENTIESCEYAVGYEGANAVEIDLSYTKDGEVVLWHDWNPNDAVALARQVGFEPHVKYLPYAPNLFSRYRRHAHELTTAELREHFGYKKRFLFFFSRKIDSHIPTFDEFLVWAKKHPRLRAVLLDMKIPPDRVDLVPEIVGKMMAKIREHDVQSCFVFLSPHQAVFDAMKEIAPNSDYSFDVEVPPGIVFEPTAYSATKTAIAMGNSYASVGRPALTMSAWKIYQQIITHDIDMLAKHNADLADDDCLRLFSWTINKRAEAKRLIDLGVNGILTDKPAVLRKLAEKRGRRVE